MDLESAFTEDSETLPEKKKSILFIDNEQALIDAVTEILIRLGYETVVTKWCSKAIKLVKSQPDRFDLVITDMNMPDMDGFELSRALKEIRPDIPIILCTGSGYLIDKKGMLAAGIREIIPKPFSMGDMAKTIEMVLEEVQ